MCVHLPKKLNFVMDRQFFFHLEVRDGKFQQGNVEWNVALVLSGKRIGTFPEMSTTKYMLKH